MRIGIDARLTYHQQAGITQYTRNLLTALAQVDQANEYLVFQHRRHREELVHGPNFRRITLYSPTHNRLEQPALLLELASRRLDLLHSTDFIPPYLTAIPSVITVHDLAFLHWPHFLTEDSASYYGQIDRAVHHARQIIVPSQSTQQDLTAQLGVPAEKIKVIYEAADEGYTPLPLAQTRAEMVQKYHLPETFILCVGTIEPRKNIGGLLHAFSHLQKKYGMKEVGLVLSGRTGWLYEEVDHTLRDLELTHHVFMLGRVPDVDLHKLYVAAHCLVHPAFYEGFGLPPLEAMACGTPTITSNTSSLPEVVGDAGLTVDPRDWEAMAVAMHRLLTSPDLHEELREKGLQRAGCFSWAKAAQEHLTVYQQVLARQVAPIAHPPSQLA